MFCECVALEKAVMDYFNFYPRNNVTRFRKTTRIKRLSDYEPELPQYIDLVM
jgi:hypothetical protein